MKYYHSLFMLFAIASLWAQGDTEVYWAELSTTENSMTLGPLTNLSQNPGYDNQPSFWSEEVLVYTATRNKQTDILTQNLNSGIKQWKREHLFFQYTLYPKAVWIQTKAND